MKYSIQYAEDFSWKSLRRIPRNDLILLREAIEQKLSLAPEVFGKPLRFSLKGCWRLRVGKYRIIYTISGTTVTIAEAGFRSIIYPNR